MQLHSLFLRHSELLNAFFSRSTPKGYSLTVDFFKGAPTRPRFTRMLIWCQNVFGSNYSYILLNLFCRPYWATAYFMLSWCYDRTAGSPCFSLFIFCYKAAVNWHSWNHFPVLKHHEVFFFQLHEHLPGECPACTQPWLSCGLGLFKTSHLLLAAPTFCLFLFFFDLAGWTELNSLVWKGKLKPIVEELCKDWVIRVRLAGLRASEW